MWKQLLKRVYSSIARKREMSKQRMPRLEDTLPFANEEDTDGSEFEEQPPLRLPSTMKLSGFGIGGGFAKSLLIPLIITCGVLVVMDFVGGVSFVTKRDFTANMVNVATVAEQAAVDSAKAKSDVDAVSQGVPIMVSTQVSNAVKQVSDQWNSQITALSSKVEDYKKVVALLQSTVANYDARIQLLEEEIVALHNRYDILVTVDGTVRQYSIANGVAMPIILNVTNLEDIPVKVPIKLVLTTDVSNIAIDRVSMSGTYTVSFSDSTVIFYMVVDVGANNTVALNPWVTLHYEGASPNTWSAVWSKQ